jgi:hypothetical protein
MSLLFTEFIKKIVRNEVLQVQCTSHGECVSVTDFWATLYILDNGRMLPQSAQNQLTGNVGLAC